MDQQSADLMEEMHRCPDKQTRDDRCEEVRIVKHEAKKLLNDVRFSLNGLFVFAHTDMIPIWGSIYLRRQVQWDSQNHSTQVCAG